MTYRQMAVGLERDDGEESRIAPFGAASAVAFYEPMTGDLEIRDIATECEDRLSLLFGSDISALYHPFPKICPTIRDRAEAEGVAILTGSYSSLDELMDGYHGFDEL